MIVLVGMPGCGKSTIGRQLARMRQLPFLDTDHEIERFLGCSIREFFDREGEAAFREVEARVIAETMSAPVERIIATGGGSVLREANRAVMKAHGTVVYLHTQPEDLARRLSRDTARPLLQVADPRQRLRDLYAARDALYRSAADIVVDTAHKSAAMLVSLISMQIDVGGESREDAEWRSMQTPTELLRPAPTRVQIDLGDRSYPILIGGELLSDARTWAPQANRKAVALVVTNVTVERLYADQLVEALAPHFARVRTLALPDGEAYKDLAHLNLVFDELLGQEADRNTVLFALGGGVVGDMTGFAAACYMRGVPFVQVPTTLLAQVDSSVGGKTAVNHPLGKNMIGAFYQPQQVVCDLGVLDTLPDREMSAGLAEVIKYGASIDVEFLGWLERHIDALRARDRAALTHAVRRCCEIKAYVVGADEKEAGLRAILNFGHTFGHAIEAGLGYGAWLHGEGVGCGMVMAAELSARLGLVPEAFARRVEALIARAGLPVRGPASMTPDRYIELMRVDKKALGGDIRFVLLDGEGHAVVRAAPEAVVVDVIKRLTATV